jgi:bacteriochlorophyll 4-vinyl reductase
MREAGIGRVLVASLHQAIGEILPTRVTFYEHWLNAEGLRGGTIGVAPLSAVLSFLRMEGDAYDRIATRAGEYAAEWTVESMPPFERSMIAAAPAWLRVRVLLRLAGRLVRNSCRSTRVVSKVKRGTARVALRDSIFCTVREPHPRPLCRFYAAAFERLLALFDLPSVAHIESCRGTSPATPSCMLRISLSGEAANTPVEVPAA